MLSECERERLRDIECRLQVEDPEFAQSFEARERVLQDDRERWDYHARRATAKIAVVVAALLGSLVLAAGSLSGALAFAAATGLVWVAWRNPQGTR